MKTHIRLCALAYNNSHHNNNKRDGAETAYTYQYSCLVWRLSRKAKTASNTHIHTMWLRGIKSHEMCAGGFGWLWFWGADISGQRDRGGRGPRTGGDRPAQGE